MRVGNQEMLLPTTMVGKYPEPRWWKGQAFANYPGRPGRAVFDSVSEEAYNDVIQCIVRDQERLGLAASVRVADCTALDTWWDGAAGVAWPATLATPAGTHRRHAHNKLSKKLSPP